MPNWSHIQQYAAQTPAVLPTGDRPRGPDHYPHTHPQQQQQQHQQQQQPGPGVRPATTGSLRRAVSRESTVPFPEAEFGCEQCCSCIIQLLLLTSLMVGFALAVAGGVLNAQHGEFLVFIYIGLLILIVSAFLLTIQCCVRCRLKQRIRTQQLQALRRAPSISLPEPSTCQTVLQVQPPQQQHVQMHPQDPRGIPLRTFKMNRQPPQTLYTTNHPHHGGVTSWPTVAYEPLNCIEHQVPPTSRHVCSVHSRSWNPHSVHRMDPRKQAALQAPPSYMELMHPNRNLQGWAEDKL